MQSPTSWLPYTSLVLAMVLWASSFIALKISFQGYHPMIVIFGRMVIGSLCFLVFYRRLRRTRVHRADLKYLLFMAFCEPCLYFIFEAKALELTTASQAGLITAMLPLMVALGAAVFLNEQVSRKMLLGFCVAIAGACWLSLAAEGSESAPHPLLGNILEFMAMVAATGYTLTVKHLSARYSPVFLTAFQSVAGALFFSLFLLHPEISLPAEFYPVPALAVFYLGSFVTLGAYLSYNYGISKIPASQASAFVNLIPVFSIILGFLILGERFSTFQYAASLLVLGGVFISQRRVRPL